MKEKGFYIFMNAFYSVIFWKIFHWTSLSKEIITMFVIGCLFHFSQAIWQQVQGKGLTTKYNQDEFFRLNVKN